MEHTNNSKPRTAIISGHMDVSPAEFTTHYTPATDLAISRNDNFILGNVQGADKFALLRHGDPTIKHRITVYPSRLYNVAKFEAIGLGIGTDSPADGAANGASSRGKNRRQRDSWARHLQHDARMTRASDYDILWVRSEDEARKLYGDKYRTRVSATGMNRSRRLDGGRNACDGR